MAYLLAPIGKKVQWYVVDITRYGGLSAFRRATSTWSMSLTLRSYLGSVTKSQLKEWQWQSGLRHDVM